MAQVPGGVYRLPASRQINLIATILFIMSALRLAHIAQRGSCFLGGHYGR
jgi:hypothetical protein